ncbi:MAG: hypothetical protein FWC16_02690 [Defluviitaleaceae bacterium]|nr:hypothetical protein [Defluviitaleaceae bacterium]MCL2273807.1 hypothetical protein [Defluviitaleaceae bacterium]
MRKFIFILLIPILFILSVFIYIKINKPFWHNWEYSPPLQVINELSSVSATHIQTNVDERNRRGININNVTINIENKTEFYISRSLWGFFTFPNERLANALEFFDGENWRLVPVISEPSASLLVYAPLSPYEEWVVSFYIHFHFGYLNPGLYRIRGGVQKHGEAHLGTHDLVAEFYIH